MQKDTLCKIDGTLDETDLFHKVNMYVLDEGFCIEQFFSISNKSILRESLKS